MQHVLQDVKRYHRDGKWLSQRAVVVDAWARLLGDNFSDLRVTCGI